MANSSNHANSNDAHSNHAHGRGHAKLILFGEHAVVYGQPAVAAGLPRGARAEARFGSGASNQLTLRDESDDEVLGQVVADPTGKPLARAFHAIVSEFTALSNNTEDTVELDITVEVPVGVGLGSSAALAVAAARSLGTLLGEPDAVEAAVTASEKVFHSNPSGIDQRAATDGGLFFFSRRGQIQASPIEAPPLTVAVCQAGPAASTAGMVEHVAAFKQRRGQLVDHLNLLIGDTARAATQALRKGDWTTLGELMDINHGALVSLGASTGALDAACHTARDAGALGAKLTGAGGGGCVFALTPDGADDVLDAWSECGWPGFSVTIGA
jgi:mevalonate kinase